MSRYDGLIIPRSYSEYINKTDAATLSQALQLPSVMDSTPTENSNRPVKSGGIYTALAGKQPTLTFDTIPTEGSENPVESGGIFAANAVIMASSTTLSGVAISAGSVVRVLFTADIAGSDAITGLTFIYNGDAYAVKVGKNGALANFNAYEVESGVFKYLQAHTTLELMFDGSQFVIMGNPVVISNADFSIMADGSLTYHDHISAGQTGFIIIGDILINYGVDTSDDTSFISLPHRYSNTNYTLIGYNDRDLSPIRGNRFTAGFGTSVSNSICHYITIGKI